MRKRASDEEPIVAKRVPLPYAPRAMRLLIQMAREGELFPLQLCVALADIEKAPTLTPEARGALAAIWTDLYRKTDAPVRIGRGDENRRPFLVAALILFANGEIERANTWIAADQYALRRCITERNLTDAFILASDCHGRELEDGATPVFDSIVRVIVYQ